MVFRMLYGSIKIRFEIVNSEESMNSVSLCYDSLHYQLNIHVVSKLESLANRSKSRTSSFKSLKRPRTSTSSNIEVNGFNTRSKTASARIVTSAQSNSNTGMRSSTPVILRSAFKAPSAAQPLIPSRWSRNPPMEKYHFIRTTASVSLSGEVTLNCVKDQQEEVIEIALDWSSGEDSFLKNKSYDTTGFIGRGATKRAIYVCFFILFFLFNSESPYAYFYSNSRHGTVETNMFLPKTLINRHPQMKLPGIWLVSMNS